MVGVASRSVHFFLLLRPRFLVDADAHLHLQHLKETLDES